MYYGGVLALHKNDEKRFIILSSFPQKKQHLNDNAGSGEDQWKCEKIESVE